MNRPVLSNAPTAGGAGLSALRRLVMVVIAALIVAGGVLAPTAAHAAGTGDDYPAWLKNAGQDTLVDPWSFYNRECTSFVAWRLNQQSGRTSAPWAFLNNMTGPSGVSVHFGNAYQWKDAAVNGGWRVDNSPEVGSVAWWSGNHVAIVTAVNGDGSVNIEEYNYGYTGTYHTRNNIRAEAYLHIADAPVNRLPEATVDEISGAPGQIHVRGWAFDRDNLGAQLAVHVYIGGPAGSPQAQGTPITANVYRPDVDDVFHVGAYHGFDAWIPTGQRGAVPIYVYAINVPDGPNPQIGQKTVDIADPQPFGSLDSVTSPQPGYLRVRGWAADPNDPTGSRDVHLYVGGPSGTTVAQFVAVTANKSRPDVAAVYPGYGDKHGYDITFRTGKRGLVPVYAYAINVGPGDNQLLGTASANVVTPKFVAVSPTRLLDTRSGVGAPKGLVPAGGKVDLQVTGRGGVPSYATTVMLNVTAVSPSRSGWVTAWPTGATKPGTSNLNFAAGQTVPNLVIAKIGAGGKVSLATSAGTHLLADVAGYYPAASAFTGLTPVRVLDTRNGVGAPKVRIPAGHSVTIAVGGGHGIPATASAAILNITAVNAAAAGSLVAFPAGTATPNAINVSFNKGQTIAGLGVVKLGAGGKVTLRSSATTDLVVDVNGWVPAQADTMAFAPRHLLTTRTVPGGTSIQLKVAGVAGVPANAQAVQVTLTATGSSRSGYLTAYPSGQTMPVVSNANFAPGQSVSNSAIVKVGAAGYITIYSSATTSIVVDTSAYFTR